jgi:hypothetical protein
MIFEHPLFCAWTGHFGVCLGTFAPRSRYANTTRMQEASLGRFIALRSVERMIGKTNEV